MTKYYFLGSILPPLKMGMPPELSYRELKPLLMGNLSKDDYGKVRVVRRFFDLYNIRSFLRGDPINSHGNFDEKELEEAILTRVGFPEYVNQYLDCYEEKEDRIKHFMMLLSAYFTNEIQRNTGFLKQLLEFERQWRLVMAGFRAKKYGKDLLEEMQYEDPKDELVVQILAQKDAPTYEPPSRYSELKSLFDEHVDNPLKLQMAFDEWRINKTRDMEGADVFSIDRILSYIYRLFLIEAWLELDKRKGMQIVDNILKEAS